MNDQKSTQPKPMGNERIIKLREEIAALKRQWPAHSTPPAMMQRLDDLEEELEKELAADRTGIR